MAYVECADGCGGEEGETTRDCSGAATIECFDDIAGSGELLCVGDEGVEATFAVILDIAGCDGDD